MRWDFVWVCALVCVIYVYVHTLCIYMDSVCDRGHLCLLICRDIRSHWAIDYITFRLHILWIFITPGGGDVTQRKQDTTR